VFKKKYYKFWKENLLN